MAVPENTIWSKRPPPPIPPLRAGTVPTLDHDDDDDDLDEDKEHKTARPARYDHGPKDRRSEGGGGVRRRIEDPTMPPVEDGDKKSPPQANTFQEGMENGNTGFYDKPKITINTFGVAACYLIFYAVLFVLLYTVDASTTPAISNLTGLFQLAFPSSKPKPGPPGAPGSSVPAKTPSVFDFLPSNTSSGSGTTTVVAPKWTELWGQMDTHQTWIRFLLFFFLFFLLWGTNVGILYGAVLQGKQTDLANRIVPLTLVTILGGLFMIVSNPAFVKIFENTLGYLVVRACFSAFQTFNWYNLKDFMANLIQDNTSPETRPKCTIAGGSRNFEFLLTAFRLDNFGDVLQSIGTKDNDKYDFHLHPGLLGHQTMEHHPLKMLFRLVVAKHWIGFLTWVWLGTIAATICSVAFLARYAN